MHPPFQFNNRFSKQLPADENVSVTPRQVSGACFSLVQPSKVSRPQVVCTSSEVASLLGLTEDDLMSQWFSQVFVGNKLLDGMKPYAMCYGGHQFGHWAGQLGDGRAINLAEVIDCNGDNQTLQLKGAGLTPYSRSADGLAVLRSSVREFLCSEAMAHLGVPTTRALSLILTGEQVMRDMFYDGNSELEPGAIVCRVAPSFVRFGNFQIHAARKEFDILKQLMDFTIRYDFPELGEPCTQVYEQWFDRVCEKTAEMIVGWMRVGFVHGVMNTDNLSILGLTIDYGPYGWLEGYDPNWTPNTTDAEGRRYSFGNQPQIAQWNLFQLANALVAVIKQTDALESSLDKFAQKYTDLANNMYADKLGLEAYRDDEDESLIKELFKTLQLTETDMTIFFRSLAKFSRGSDYSDEAIVEVLKDAYYKPEELDGEIKDNLIVWCRCYLTRISGQEIDDEQRRQKMNLANPKYVLRNYLAQQAIEKAEKGDFSEVKKLLEVIKKPYDEQPENEYYANKRPEWARIKAGCSMLSCSS